MATVVTMLDTAQANSIRYESELIGSSFGLRQVQRWCRWSLQPIPQFSSRARLALEKSSLPGPSTRKAGGDPVHS